MHKTVSIIVITIVAIVMLVLGVLVYVYFGNTSITPEPTKEVTKLTFPEGYDNLFKESLQGWKSYIQEQEIETMDLYYGNIYEGDLTKICDREPNQIYCHGIENFYSILIKNEATNTSFPLSIFKANDIQLFMDNLMKQYSSYKGDKTKGGFYYDKTNDLYMIRPVTLGGYDPNDVEMKNLNEGLGKLFDEVIKIEIGAYKDIPAAEVEVSIAESEYGISFAYPTMMGNYMYVFYNEGCEQENIKAVGTIQFTSSDLTIQIEPCEAKLYEKVLETRKVTLRENLQFDVKVLSVGEDTELRMLYFDYNVGNYNLHVAMETNRDGLEREFALFKQVLETLKFSLR